MDTKKRKGPAALVELCHDTLAEGVLEKHDGLPESWLKLFRQHPAAWAQLQEAVLAPVKRYISNGRELTKESTLLVSWRLRPYDQENAYWLDRHSQFVAPAAGLPKWFFILLQARLKLITSDGVDGTGGHYFEFKHPEEVANVWKEICEYLPTDNTLGYADSPDGRAVDKALLDLFLALASDSRECMVNTLATKLSLDPIEVAVHIETTIWSNRKAAADIITEALHDPKLLEVEWASTLNWTHRKANQAANYFRAPALSLHFDYVRWWEERSH